MKMLQKGFTLVEIMIVLVIIGILLSIAVPNFQNYIARSQVSEGIEMATNAKSVITDNLQNGICTDPNIPANDTITGRYAQLVISGDSKSGSTGINPTDHNGCIVTITYGHGVADNSGNFGGASSLIQDRKLVLKMMNNGSYMVDGGATDLPKEFIPKSLSIVGGGTSGE